jgi:hypothetical protein
VRDFGSIDAAITAVDPEDVAFERLCGPWQPWSIDETGEALAGFDGPWWVCGGQAIDAFTGTERPHDDLDIGFFAVDLPRLRNALGSTYHLWSAGAGMLRPLDDEHPDLHSQSSQVWVREHAWAPWRLDLLATPGGGHRWVNKRDQSIAMDLDAATWVRDGVRYLAPELVLLMKARHARPKDELDLERTLPLLDTRQRDRLGDLLAHVHPEHAWLERLDD